MNRFIGILGIFVILGISYLLSNNNWHQSALKEGG